ncbi:dUTPase [Liquorilactobacillus uvarum]|uniref:dUTPase n=1 Tax=Liquorilactobacillus uvarum TaxID=303240 RepID=UPI00288C1AEE|nr:dUTPase [Liquorilactobacillus uvarum]
MQIKEMIDIARHFEDGSLAGKFTDEEKAAVLYLELNSALAVLFSKTAEKMEGTEVLASYCDVLCAFCRVGNYQKWTYLMLLSDEETDRMRQKWTSHSFAKLFMILQQQLNKSFFERQNEPFLHAWHILIKFGLVELGYTPTQIEEKYFEKFTD